MKKVLMVALLVSMAGCGTINPSWNKAITEKKQLEELKKQTVSLERIATALEKIASK